MKMTSDLTNLTTAILILTVQMFLDQYTYLNKSITIKSRYKMESMELNEGPVCA
jgi:hypothetical protein